jgi:hypothetical protein
MSARLIGFSYNVENELTLKSSFSGGGFMETLNRYILTGNESVAIEIDDGQPGGGGPVSITDRLKDTGKTLDDALQALPPLVTEIRKSIIEKFPSPGEVSIEFGIKIGGEIGLIVSKSQAECNFKITVKWKP